MDQDLENQPTQQRSTLGELGAFIFDLVKVFLISAVIFLPVLYFVAQPFIVSGASMEPNFHTGEYLILNELAYHMQDPHRDDIIVFKYRKNKTQYFITR